MAQKYLYLACTAHGSMNPDILHLIPGKTQAVVCYCNISKQILNKRLFAIRVHKTGSLRFCNVRVDAKAYWNYSFLENKTQENLRVSSDRIFPSEAITGSGILFWDKWVELLLSWTYCKGRRQIMKQIVKYLWAAVILHARQQIIVWGIKKYIWKKTKQNKKSQKLLVCWRQGRCSTDFAVFLVPQVWSWLLPLSLCRGFEAVPWGRNQGLLEGKGPQQRNLGFLTLQVNLRPPSWTVDLNPHGRKC